MLRSIRLLACMLFLLSFVVADAQAKGGPGKGQRGGGGHGGGGRKGTIGRSTQRTHTVRNHELHRPHAPRRPNMHGPSQFGQRPTVGPRERFTNRQPSAGTGTDSTITDQRLLREERKLQHRRQVAEHLRNVGDRNGNSKLYDVADRMEQKAQAHYDRKAGPLDGALPTDQEMVPTDPLAEPGPLEPTIQKLTGRQNALYRQLRNEERKLAKRMEAAEQLRQLAEANGDPTLLQSAEALEQSALGHYNQRMAKIAAFQERFGLETPDEFLTVPTAIEP